MQRRRRTSASRPAQPSAASTACPSRSKTTSAQSSGARQPGARDAVCSRCFRRSPPLSSRVLSNFQPCYNATAVQRLLDAGAVPVGKTVMDEFGMGSFTLNREGALRNHVSAVCARLLDLR